MSELPSALLTNKQRDYVMGRVDHENAANERNMRSRIRKRVYTGLDQDGKILSNIDPELRRDIFREWEDKNYKRHPKIENRKNEAKMSDRFYASQFRFGIQGILEFIYLGVEEGDVGDFKEILKDAIDQAVRDRGRYVKEFNLDIEFGELATIEDVDQMLDSGTLSIEDLTVGEINTLLDLGLMNEEDLPEGYFEALSSGLEALEEQLEDLDLEDRQKLREVRLTDSDPS